MATILHYPIQFPEQPPPDRREQIKDIMRSVTLAPQANLLDRLEELVTRLEKLSQNKA